MPFPFRFVTVPDLVINYFGLDVPFSYPVSNKFKDR